MIGPSLHACCRRMLGLIGYISTLLYGVDDGMSDTFRELPAYFSAALIAGLPV